MGYRSHCNCPSAAFLLHRLQPSSRCDRPALPPAPLPSAVLLLPRPGRGPNCGTADVLPPPGPGENEAGLDRQTFLHSWLLRPRVI